MNTILQINKQIKHCQKSSFNDFLLKVCLLESELFKGCRWHESGSWLVISISISFVIGWLQIIYINLDCDWLYLYQSISFVIGWLQMPCIYLDCDWLYLYQSHLRLVDYRWYILIWIVIGCTYINLICDWLITDDIN